MLRLDVIEAITAGQFAIYPVDGIETLTRLPAGERDEAGKYAEG